MKIPELTEATLDKALAKVKVSYRISKTRASNSLPWEAYWPNTIAEDLRYFATEQETKVWILDKARGQA